MCVCVCMRERERGIYFLVYGRMSDCVIKVENMPCESFVYKIGSLKLLWEVNH